jgi:branched-chain amino acid aminotransferase
MTIAELLKAQKEERLLECFGAGTAAIVSPVKLINYKGQDYKIPLDPSDASSQAGPLTKRFAETIMSIQYGEVSSPWSVVVE